MLAHAGAFALAESSAPGAKHEANLYLMKLPVVTIPILISLALTAQTPPAPHKIQVLIITGQDKHPWRETTPYLREILTQTGKFEVRVTEEFRGANAETLAPYDVAVLNYS